MELADHVNQTQLAVLSAATINTMFQKFIFQSINHVPIQAARWEALILREGILLEKINEAS